MDESGTSFGVKLPELEKANFSGELCKDAARLLLRAISRGDAYVINDTLVLKFRRSDEAQALGMKETADLHNYDYGVRVALCIKDHPPFKRGEWYTFSDEQMRRQVVEAGDERKLTLSTAPDKWKHVVEVARINKTQLLLSDATRYAERLRT